MQIRKYRSLMILALTGLLFTFFATLRPARPVSAETETEPPQVIIYIFWGDGCPHCAKAKEYLEMLDRTFSQVEIRSFEVWDNQENQALFYEMAQAFDFSPRGVPTIFIGDYHWEGFGDSTSEQIEEVLQYCLQVNCKDAGEGIYQPSQLTEITLAPTSTVEPSPTLTPNAETTLEPVASITESQPSSTSTPTPAALAAPIISNNKNANTIKLPLIGEIDLTTQSLALSTAIIAFVDGVNPCSIWVLSILLSLTLHTGSRRKVIIIGLVFISITALVYVLFIAGLFSLFTYISFLGWIQVVIALLALFFALVNIKDYFWYKEGISFTIADDKKPGIFQKIRKVMDSSQTLWGLLSATVVLAGGVSLVEFSCTAGFPVLWTNLLAAQGVSGAHFIFLLLIYMLIYQIDELAIFFVAVFTLKSSKLEEKHGRVLKLIGGTLMLTLAAVMIVDPTIMNSVGNSLIIFGIAFAVAMLVLLVHRIILPAFGIWIGSEDASHKKQKARH